MRHQEQAPAKPEARGERAGCQNVSPGFAAGWAPGSDCLLKASGWWFLEGRKPTTQMFQVASHADLPFLGARRQGAGLDCTQFQGPPGGALGMEIGCGTRRKRAGAGVTRLGAQG